MKSEPVDEAELWRGAGCWKCSGRRWPGLGLLKRWAYCSLARACFSGFRSGLVWPNCGAAGALSSSRGLGAGTDAGGSRSRTMLGGLSKRLLELPRWVAERSSLMSLPLSSSSLSSCAANVGFCRVDSVSSGRKGVPCCFRGLLVVEVGAMIVVLSLP